MYSLPSFIDESPRALYQNQFYDSDTIYCIKRNNTTELTKLLSNGADPNETSLGGWPLLCIAIRLGRGDIIDILIFYRADVNQTKRNGDSPLMEAVYLRSLQTIRKLVDAGANVNYISNSGLTAIGYACELGNEYANIIRMLIECGAKGDVYGHNFNQRSNPLKSLCSAGPDINLEIIELLLRANFNPNISDQRGFTPIFKAIESNSYSAVKLLIEFGADVNHIPHSSGGTPPLIETFVRHTYSITELLLQNGADVNFGIEQHCDTLIHLIYYSSWYYEQSKLNNIIDLLILRGVDPFERNIEGLTVLEKASESGRKDIVDYLLRLRSGFPTSCVEEKKDAEEYLEDDIQNLQEYDDDGFNIY